LTVVLEGLAETNKVSESIERKRERRKAHRFLLSANSEDLVEHLVLASRVESEVGEGERSGRRG